MSDKVNALGDYVELQRGTTYKGALLNKNNEGPVLLGLASIARNGGFRSDNLKNYSGDSSEKLLLYPGDLFVSLKDVTQEGDLLGAVARVPKEIKVGRLTQDTVGLIIKDQSVKKEYLYWILRTPEYRGYCRLRATGTTNLGLSRTDFLSFPVPVFNLTREYLIKSLESLEEKIDLNRKMNQTLEAMAQALFKSWFVDFDPVIDNALAQGNEIPEELQARAEKRKGLSDSKKLLSTNPSLAAHFPVSFVFNETLGKWIPEGWEVKSFGDLMETTIGGDWGKDNPDERHTEEVKIIRGTDIPSINNCDIESAPTRYVEPKKLKSRKLEVGDIVIEVSGGSPTQPTGRSIRITKNILDRLGGIVEPASFCRRFKPKSDELSILCSEQLTYIYGIGKMWEYQNQSTGISNFQTSYFLDAEMVLIPSKEEILQSFFSQVSRIKDKSTSNENIVLTQLRDRLLPELISGRVRVPDDK